MEFPLSSTHLEPISMLGRSERLAYNISVRVQTIFLFATLHAKVGVTKLHQATTLSMFIHVYGIQPFITKRAAFQISTSQHLKEKPT